jgi:hypothetical protein
MNALARIPSWIASHWRATAAFACAVGIAAVACKSLLETEEARDQRAQLNRKRELRRLTDSILAYGRKVHERYPSGDVIVSVHDLAEKLRRGPEVVAMALNLLLEQEKVQRAPLNGYWRLKV